MKMYVINEKRSRSMELGVESLIRVEYLPAKETGIRTLIDLEPGEEIADDAMVLAIYSRGNDGNEVPHIYVRPEEWVLKFE